MPSNPKQQGTARNHLSQLGVTATTNANASTEPLSKSTASPHVSKTGSIAAPSDSVPPRTSPDLADREDPVAKENGTQQPAGTMAPAVNRKKQKRRQKQAARQATEQQLNNGFHAPDTADQNGHPASNHEAKRSEADHVASLDGFEDEGHYEHVNGEEYYYEDENGHVYAQQHGQPQPEAKGPDGPETKAASGKKKKKGKKGRSASQNLAEVRSSTSLSTPSASTSRPPPSVSKTTLRTAQKAKDRIWNTSTQEERENIKTFWLELGEEERRALVKVEKDAVLKKMKEQQKHSCSCTVCGRKRTAIEEELEVLYDAYYEELEQYANNNQGSFENGAPIVPPPRLYQPPLRSLDRHSHVRGQHHPSRGRVQELPDDDEDLEDEYDEDDEEDEPYSEDELEDEATRSARADFFAFGNSLTVKDGILTVADDLLKNDGKHFIDMMEQLAERRMQREEDTQYGMAAHQSLHAGHNHGPLDEDDYDDEEEDEEYDSQDEEYEEDEMVRCDDRGTAYGRGQANVPDICCPNV
ncbi:hypothetical protein VTN02DRAFT_1032 [Thermoascus thermophilus]